MSLAVFLLDFDTASLIDGRGVPDEGFALLAT